MTRDQQLADLEAALQSAGLVVATDAALGARTTYRVGGNAALLVEVDQREDLAALGAAMVADNVPVVVVGKGSNMLVADAGFDGLAVALGESLSAVEHLGDARVRIGAAASLPVAARQLTTHGLAGFEWAVGVPGTLGGAVRMNAGGHGSDMAASVVRASVLDLATGTLEVWDQSRLAFGYRRSAIGAHHVVVDAELQLVEGDVEAGKQLLSEIVSWRRANQPGGQNAGSVFTNPPGDSAGRLIDDAGLKGHRIRTAEVSTKHANFIQADPDGCADDVFELMVFVVQRVYATAGVWLHPETHLVGFGDRASVLASPGPSQPQGGGA